MKIVKVMGVMAAGAILGSAASMMISQKTSRKIIKKTSQNAKKIADNIVDMM